MKYYLSSFLVLLLFACKQGTGQQTDSDHAHIMHGEDADPKIYLEFNGRDDARQVVLIAGDEEYRSEETLPQLARILSRHHGFNCKVLFPQHADRPGFIDPNHLHNIPGLETLDNADLMIIATRFRDLPDQQMQHIDRYLKMGKPVIGIRTATHAFQVKDTTSQWYHYSNSYNNPESPWDGGFGRLVLGEKWISHHGHHKHQSTRGVIAAASHPISNGIEDGDIWGPTDVYGVRLPMLEGTQPIVLGQVMNRPGEFQEADIFFGMKPTDGEVANEAYGNRTYNPNDPMMPVAWTKTYQLPGGKAGRSFTSTVGSSTDFLSEGVRRLYVNAVHWLLGEEVPEKAGVALIGNFEPNAYSFHDDQHWVDMNWTLKGIRALE